MKIGLFFISTNRNIYITMQKKQIRVNFKLFLRNSIKMHQNELFF